ncbi:HEAT repeat domain-containing protein [Candidatus Micrarchaeota archaeon]|nr:HEAT repeat domain-containing protein [Candidatus Micrarchaeota archaeon]
MEIKAEPKEPLFRTITAGLSRFIRNISLSVFFIVGHEIFNSFAMTQLSRAQKQDIGFLPESLEKPAPRQMPMPKTPVVCHAVPPRILYTPNTLHTISALRTMGYMRKPRFFDEKELNDLFKELKDEDPGRREIAAGKLINAENPEATEPLIEALKDESAGVRKNALRSLSRRRDAIAFPDVLGMLDDEDMEVQVAVIWSLAGFGNPDAIEPLFSKLEKSGEDVKKNAVRALGRVIEKNIDKNTSKETLMGFLRRIKGPGAKEVALKLYRKWLSEQNDNILLKKGSLRIPQKPIRNARLMKIK